MKPHIVTHWLASLNKQNFLNKLNFFQVFFEQKKSKKKTIYAIYDYKLFYVFSVLFSSY